MAKGILGPTERKRMPKSHPCHPLLGRTPRTTSAPNKQNHNHLLLVPNHDVEDLIRTRKDKRTR